LTWETFIPSHDIPVWWHTCGVMLVITMFLFDKSVRTSNIIVICITQLPGVVLHELAHLLTGILFQADPCNFNLIPERRCDGRWALGSVAFRRVTAFNAVPIALAPLGLVPIAYYIYRHWFNWLPLTLANTLLLYATVFLLIYNAPPSRQDVRVACNWKCILLYGSVSGVVGYLWVHYRA
jgi:hypothetical protein